MIIACIGKTNNLIIGTFWIENKPYNVIVDTGASASFIPEDGCVLKQTDRDRNDVISTAKTADNETINITSSIELATSPMPNYIPQQNETYFIIPKRNNLLGQAAIIGLNLIKKFRIEIILKSDIMCAYIEEHLIAKETPINSLCASAVTYSWESRVRNMLKEYEDVFSETAKSFIDCPPMPIPLESQVLVKARLRRHSPEDIEEMRIQINRLLENEVIEHSQSSYSSNAHLVPKKNGQKRLVVNFIPLNNIAIKDHYPIPRVEDLFQSSKGANLPRFGLYRGLSPNKSVR